MSVNQLKSVIPGMGSTSTPFPPISKIKIGKKIKYNAKYQHQANYF
jgi:hypothetical protein